ncbi:tryptophan synthase beta subunit-like PLP-dependent enzyme [Aspergillus karnatakaensis]|uniref:putative L-serine dehydratase n=1 Tax=Aspergillus karnatakaensis TaxID=1810916 RepID=UPI003CCCB18C
MVAVEKKPWIETPLIESAPLSKTAGCRVFLKLELLQPSGSFKSRGIGNFIRTTLRHPSNKGKNLHFFISSGGNAGLAAVIAARDLGCSCTVVVPLSTKPMMVQKLWNVGATDIVQVGASWFEADTHLRKTFIENQDVSKTGTENVYVPPFDHPDVWAGAGTLIEEVAKQLPARENEGGPFPADVVICSVGGGGLFNGVVGALGRHIEAQKGSEAAAAGRKVRVLAAETKGADSLALSLREQSLQSLPAITSLATSLGALQVAPQAFKYAQSPPAGVDVVSVVRSDAEAARGLVRLSDEHRLEVELACGISVDLGSSAKLKESVSDLTPESRVVVVVCGGSNISAETIAEYRQKLADGWA